MISFLTNSVTLSVIGGILFFLVIVLPSLTEIGPNQVGLVMRRFGTKLPDDNPIAFKGEAGYQSELLMPGLHFRLWVWYSVTKHSWVQVPAGEIGVVIAQVGKPTPIGAKSGIYKKEFGNFSDLNAFIDNEGQKGVQRPVLQPGTLIPIHPVAFLVVTRSRVYGMPMAPELQQAMSSKQGLTPQHFGLNPNQLSLVRIEPEREGEKLVDYVGLVTTREGEPLPAGLIASRLGGFEDIEKLEKNAEKKDADLVETLLGSQNDKHNNYQDFQKFLDAGGKIGLQHDPLLYGTYALNPFLVSVEIVPMLIVEQGEVAVIKSYVGLPTQDTSGEGFKHGSLVRPGRRGIWREPLRTGKYPINPRCYSAVKVPTAILTLNWAEATSKAHDLDGNLSQIEAKSKEGFVFKIDLQVQIHVPDTNAPRVISRVATMSNLVNEVLQAAVGNYFRDKLQGMEAVQFIQEREAVQKAAFDHIKDHLAEYEVETPGVYIQDVIFPDDLVTVLQDRELAKQKELTFQAEEKSQTQRVAMEAAKGKADMQAELARSEVGITIKQNNANARKAEADGEATFIEKTGRAKGAEIESIGLARAKGYEAQVQALGQGATAMVNAVEALAKSSVPFMPQVMVGGNGGSFDGVMGLLMQSLQAKNGGQQPARRTEDVQPPIVVESADTEA